ncbi:MAG: glucosaminidase domain-containing protein [Rikenellaceae bacterium]
MIKKSIFVASIVIILLSISNLSAQTRQTRQEYIAKYKDIAINHMERYGIPASITMAQGILESDCGNSRLATSSNNHFGIKCKSNWTGRSVNHTDDAPNECFRAYDSVEESYRDHAEFLDTSERYDSLFSYSSADYTRWAHGLKAAGYATSPQYASALIKIIEDEQLYILDKDNGGRLYAERHRAEEEAARKRDQESANEEKAEYIDPNRFKVTINAHKGYNIERTNGLFFTRAKEGDSIESIAKIFEISKNNLRRFNDLKKGAEISQGDIIFIERKKARWEDDNKRTHQTADGETLYTISQSYGIRLSRLIRLNKLKDNSEIKTSQIIKLK